MIHAKTGLYTKAELAKMYDTIFSDKIWKITFQNKIPGGIVELRMILKEESISKFKRLSGKVLHYLLQPKYQPNSCIQEKAHDIFSMRTQLKGVILARLEQKSKKILRHPALQTFYEKFNHMLTDLDLYSKDYEKTMLIEKKYNNPYFED